MKLIYCFIIIFLLQSCYEVNKKTSEISTLNNICLAPNAWLEINKDYSTDYITNPKLIEVLDGFRNEPFTTEVLYFKNNPEELIAISTDHYGIRYVYNPKISDQILNGLSPQLNEMEKKRIHKRIQTLLMEYQCEKGQKESLKAIEE